MTAPHEPQAVATRPARRRPEPLAILIWSLAVLGALSMASALPDLRGGHMPPVWQLVLATGCITAGDVALLHLRFGHDQQSFTLSETALVIGLVLLPSPWLRLAAPVGVGLAKVAERRPLQKVVFNAGAAAVGARLARIVMTMVVATGPKSTNNPRFWLGLAGGSFVFFVWNGLTVSAAVAFSQRLRLREVYARGLLLNFLVWLGNTCAGMVLVFVGASSPMMLLVFPILIGLLFLAYRSYLRAMQERDMWEVLQATSRQLLQVDEAELCTVVVERSASLFAAEFVELLLVDAEPGTRATGARLLVDGGVEQLEGSPFDLAGAVWGRVLTDREPFELLRSKAAAAQRRELEDLDLGQMVVAPLIAQDRCLGVLRVGFRGPIKFGSRQLQVLSTFANSVSVAAQNARLFGELRSIALHDNLTSLPNRAVLLDRLEDALSRIDPPHRQVALLFLDIDRFKVVNDSLGHEVGDRLLVEVAKRVVANVRPGDIATRFGGDEFVVLCEGITGERQALEIADRLTESLGEPIVIGAQELFVTASVGVAVATSRLDDPVSLLRDADAAMYRAKDRGRDRSEVFNKQMRTEAVTRLRTEHDLHRALDRGELRLHYQAYVGVDGQRVIGAEALIRWEHPQRGLVPPMDFIPLAEETGFIVPLGRWVVNEACRQLAQWRRDLPGLPDDFCVGINLSPRQLISPTIVDDVAMALRESGVPAGSICLEITESGVVDADGAIDTLVRLRELGVQLAIDDFGTGYSALSYLPSLPVDVIKVDRSFISRLGASQRDRALLAGMIELAHALDLTVVAEGVETPAQLSELQTLGCDVAQGFYFSKPQPAEGLLSTLRTAAMVDSTIL